MAVAAALVGILMTAALKAAGQILLTRTILADRALGKLFADGLLNEILRLPYCEPGTSEPTLGLDSDEVAGVRTGFDDVDDYHNLVESPPKAYGGSTLANLTGWSRTATVAWVRSTDFSSADSQSGAKRITVTVTFNGNIVATASTVRTDAF